MQHKSPRQYSDQMYCSHCQLTWDTNDMNPPECKKAGKPFVHRPIAGLRGWVVRITAEKSPLSKLVEKIPASSREQAWEIYRHVRKELGQGL